MEIYKELSILENYNLWLCILGIAILAAATLPRLLSEYPFSLSITLLGIGFAATALPLGLTPPSPFEHGKITEHLTELGVIVALMGAGLKIDRPPDFTTWNSTWRLLAVTMLLSILLAAFAGWLIAGFVSATAMLLGAVVAPTDPVLASEVQISSPGAGHGNIEPPDGDPLELEDEDEVRFALTSEAGLNDGLAFPFTYMAIAMGLAGSHPGNWFVDWLLIDVLYKLGIGGLAGLLLGYMLARVLLSVPAETHFAKTLTGLGALASTLIIYGATEYIGGYGFISTFVGAVTIRNYERKHNYHESLHLFAEKSERILMGVILVAFGAAVGGGLLEPLNLALVISAIVIVFIIRPFSGIIAFIGFDKIPWRERLAISFFGIRGIGSLYYLSYALNQYDFSAAEEIWALVGLVVILSIFTHGISASPVTAYLDKLRQQA